MGSQAARDDDLRQRFGRAREPEVDVSAARLLARLQATVRGEPGELGRYRIIGRLGRGGFGEVYEAFDPLLQRRVALKVLRAAGMTAQLRHEARALAAIRHPNVVEVFEVGVHGGDLFVAMELVEGGDLAQWMATPRRIPEIVAVLLDAAAGLAAAHDGGLVHADFKPSNVLVGRDGRIKVADFGLAQPIEHGAVTTGDAAAGTASESSPKAGGTLPYMAPEQQRGAPASVRSDVFAFCATAFEVLSGQRAFAERTAVAQLEAKLAQARAPWASSVPEVLCDLIDRGLHPDPAQRPRDMHELMRELRRASKPTRLRSRVAIALAAVASMFAVLAQAERADGCRAAATLPAWSAAVHGAIAEPELDADARRLAAELDARRQSWLMARDTACQSSESHARAEALACLEGSRVRTQAFVDELATHDAPASFVGPMLRGLRELPRADDCALGAASPTVSAQDPTFVALVSGARAAMGAGELVRAQTLVTEALAFADASGDPIARADAMRARGVLAVEQYDIVGAQEALHAAYWLATSSGDDTTAALAAADLVLVAANYEGRVDAADTWRRHAEAALARLPATDALELHLVENLQQFYNEHGRLDDSLRSAERALVLAERVDGGRGPETIRAIRHHVDTLHLAGEYERALPLALALFDEARALFGEDHAETGLAELVLGNSYLNAGDAARGEIHLANALANGVRLYGRSSAFNITAMQNLASARSTLGRYQEAESLFVETLALIRATLGDRHRRYAWVLGAIGHVQTQLGRHAEAERTLGDALALWLELEVPPGFQVALTYSNLADVALARGDAAAARPLAERALATVEAAGAADHPMVATARANLGRALAAGGAHDEAVGPLRRAVEDLGRAGLTAEASYAGVWLGQSLAAAGRDAEAREVLEVALAHLRTHGPADAAAEAEAAVRALGR